MNYNSSTIGNGGRPLDPELDIGSLGRALWARRRWLFGPALLIALLATVAVNVITPRYKSEARILIEAHENVFLRPEAEKVPEREQALVDQEAVTSQVQVMLSRDLARRVVSELKLGKLPEFDPALNGISPFGFVLRLVSFGRNPLKVSSEERVLGSYFDRLTVFQVEKSRVIAIQFVSSDPEIAASVANAVAEDYLAMHRTARQEDTRAASRWLGGEIENLRRKVAEAEAKVEDFRAKSNLFLGTNNNTLSNQQLAEINTQLAAARSRKADSEAKAEFIRDALRSGKSLESADFLNSELIRRLAEQRVAVRAQLAEQSSTLLDAHPRIKELKAQLADLDQAIRGEAERLARALENDARIADARVNTLNNNLDQLKRQAAATNGQDVELRALEREAKAQRDLLESYLAKYRETTARDNLSAIPTDARVISRALVSNTPYYPRKVASVLIALLATFILAATLITSRELMFANSYRGTLPGDLPVRIAGEPLMRAEPAPASSAIPTSAEQALSSDLHDSIADIAAALQSNGVKRVLVIGADADVETAAATMALARALALGARVIAIDLAFTAPKLAAFALNPMGPGVGELVGGAASFGQIITRDRKSRVHIVPAGDVKQEGTGLLASERLHMGIGALTHAYDHMVINAGAPSEEGIRLLLALTSNTVLVATGCSPEVTASARQWLLTCGMEEPMVVSGAARLRSGGRPAAAA